MSGLEERKSFTVFGATFYYDHSWPRSTSSINNSSLIYRCIAFCVSIHQRQIHSIRPAWDNTLSRFMLLVGDPFCGGDNETMLLNYSNGCLLPFMKPLTFLQTMVAVVLVAGPRTSTQQRRRDDTKENHHHVLRPDSSVEGIQSEWKKQPLSSTEEFLKRCTAPQESQTDRQTDSVLQHVPYLSVYPSGCVNCLPRRIEGRKERQFPLMNMRFGNWRIRLRAFRVPLPCSPMTCGWVGVSVVLQSNPFARVNQS